MPNTWSNFIHVHTLKSTRDLKEPIANALAPINNNLGMLSVSGEDKEAFLQGQLTCDVSTLTNTSALPGAICNPKGRVKANVTLFLHQHEYLLILPKDNLDIAFKHLKKYALFSKVNLVDVSKKWACIAHQGSKTAPPASHYALSQKENMLTLHYPSDKPFALHLSQNDTALIDFLQPILAAETTLLSEDFWDYLNIQARLANIHPHTSGLFTPQMLELEKYQGVSFSKGCYLGQEVIARTQHLGKLKRHLQKIHLPALNSLSAGDPIIDSKSNELGTLLSTTPDTNECMVGLAVIEDRGLSDELFINEVQIQVADPS